MALPFGHFESGAQDLLDGRINEGFFQQNPFLSLVSARNLSATQRGKPGLQNLLGAMRPQSSAERKSLRGSTFYRPRMMTGKFGGGGGVGYRQPAPGANNVNTTGALTVPWTLFMQQAKVMKDDLQAASGEFEVGNLLKEAIDIAVKELEQNVSTSVWTGNPTSQTANQLEDFVGIATALDTDIQATYFGSGNRESVDTFLLPAYIESDSAVNFDWSLIDNVNKGGGNHANPNGGAATLGSGVDLVMCNPTLFYDSVKPKARADGHQIITQSGMHEKGMVGFQRDVVDYNGTLITFDPSCPAGATGKSALACLTLRSWTFQIHPDSAFKIGAWTDIQASTRERALVADIEVKGRLVCEEPWLQGYYNDVN